MKKIVFVFTLLLAVSGSFIFPQEVVSDVAIYNEVKHSFNSGFYPGTVSAANQLQSSYPDSSFLRYALAYKGEALINMKSYDEALKTLEAALTYMHSGAPEFIRSRYLMGRAYFELKNFPLALENLYIACKLSKTNGDYTSYPESVLYAGRAYFELNDFEKSILLFEYVVKNGKKYSEAEYSEVLQKLFMSYNKTGRSKNTIALFAKLDEAKLQKTVFMNLCMYQAEALEQQKDFKAAYDSYCRILESGQKELCVNALKRAYIISSENAIADSGEILAKTKDNFKENPEFLNEFWLRLGIDEFNAKNFSKAETYLSNINADSENGDVFVLRELYLAKIVLEQNRPAQIAEKHLADCESLVKKSKIEKISDAFYTTQLKCLLQLEKWNEMPLVYAKIKEPDSSANKVISLYYYKNSQFEKVLPDSGEIYANALCKLQKYEQACKEFEKFNSVCADYAIALFRCGRFEKSYQIAAATNDFQSDYICGLCCVNLKEWKKAAAHFAIYITKKSTEEKFNSLSLYYKGFAEYNLSEFKNSYASFVRFAMESKDKQNDYVLKSYEFAVKSALQNGDFKSASLQAANLVKYSKEGEAKQKAVILSAEIFADYKNYDSAIQVLEPYTNQKNEFGAHSLFVTAQMYEKQNKILLADEVYKKIYEELSFSAYAEEAMYRSGEIFYLNGNYAEAFSRFNKYIYKYAVGNFSEAALFYSGECALKLGETERCIMMNKTLLQKYPQSVYAYGANKNLLTASYTLEDYSQALSIAREMVKEFPKQAADDEIGKRLVELEKIVSGTDRRVAEKQTEFSKFGGEKTVEGRKAGTQLVRLYAESLYTQKEAYELAQKLLAKQTAAERADAAYNAEFIGDYSRREGNNKKAAEFYLRAAEFYRAAQNDSGAAAALYGAAEAFAADGLLGDAKETAALLKELYPQSLQAERVDRVTGQARN
ncbi:MAG: tetratricopeptide repeat protein [Treponema sp.]|nr:tetratricopeptide repeat protein [Treponema sp.]